MQPRGERCALFCAFAVGIGLRVLAAGFQTLSHDAAAYYLPNARALVEGGLGNWEAMSIAVPPLFPMLVALLGKFTGDLEVAALAISVVAGALVSYPAAGIARLFFPNVAGVAALAAWMAALCPYAVRFGGDARADALYTLLIAYAIWCGIVLLRNPRALTGALFGVLVGCAYLLRPEALGLPVLLAAGVFVQAAHSFRAGEEWRTYSTRVLTAGLLGCVCLFPAIAWNMAVVHAKLGLWTLSPKAGILLDYDKADGSDPFSRLNAAKSMTMHEEKLSNPTAYRSFTLVAALKERPRQMFSAMARNLKEFFLVMPGALGVLLSVFLGIGLFAARTNGVRGALVIPSAVATFYAVSFSVFYVSQRFWVPLLVLFYPWCAAGAIALCRWCAARGVGMRAVIALSLAAVVPETLQVQHWNEFQWRSDPERVLGERLQARYEPGTVCLSTKGIVTWHARGSHLFIPNAPFEDVVAYMRHRGARLIIQQVPAASVANAGNHAANQPVHATKPRDERVIQLMHDLDASPHFTRVDVERTRERMYVVYEFRERK